MITLAFGQMAYFLENSPLSAYTGGENGLPGVPVPHTRAGAPGRSSVAARIADVLACWRCCSWAASALPGGSPTRRSAWCCARSRRTPRAPPCWGIRAAYKLAAFVIAALYAGLAGGLLGVLQSYMPPDAFALDTSGQLVVQTVIGGVGTLIGPTARRGAVAVAARQPAGDPRHRRAVEADPGADLHRLVIVLRRGIAGEIRYRWRRIGRPAAGEAAEAQAGASPRTPAFAARRAAGARAHPGHRPWKHTRYQNTMAACARSRMCRSRYGRFPSMPSSVRMAPVKARCSRCCSMKCIRPWARSICLAAASPAWAHRGSRSLASAKATSLTRCSPT